MWQIHPFDSLLNLGICKEYPIMARAKTPRSNGVSKPVAAEKTGITEVKRHSAPIPINLDEEIRHRAYELYEERGRESGHDHDDWLVAEREVRARYQQQSA